MGKWGQGHFSSYPQIKLLWPSAGTLHPALPSAGLLPLLATAVFLGATRALPLACLPHRRGPSCRGGPSSETLHSYKPTLLSARVFISLWPNASTQLQAGHRQA